MKIYFSGKGSTTEFWKKSIVKNRHFQKQRKLTMPFHRLSTFQSATVPLCEEKPTPMQNNGRPSAS